ncbi:2-amino-4-hydroxy-6-hydroxymethyldihydropteridine diphosphokinase [Solilutibacter silvestris]|uniref:2-amino-4-hydroxy-6-hydroxymethyldihydropteridine pyrophosphokinase n=1 Tax=Solilutibacter silvestris TaxID=1645665 RepID=A0A2K1Q1K4_9GAMM|nr:2-amino-4-hydroxy-6-hydroxymethyldihydropteridine diphosphokinase [Lysobacter silvestris]PNS08928.1 folK: 2-amino-4-hydroxy-6-hydroxymethyldihydropteridine diphosphokinase [Lysobacter silvestris]
MGHALLSLGSNVDPLRHLQAAADALRTRFGEVRLSTIHRYPAVGFDGGDFLNAAAAIDSDLDPHALNDWLHALEDAHGRDRSGPRFGDRTLDIDIVYYDHLVMDGANHLQLPRNEIRHAFVLKPLAEIAPDYIDPVRMESLAALWAMHPDHDTQFEYVDWNV